MKPFKKGSLEQKVIPLKTRGIQMYDNDYKIKRIPFHSSTNIYIGNLA